MRLVKQLVQLFFDYFLKLLGSFLDSLVPSIMDKVGIGTSYEVNQDLGIASKFPCDLEPFILGLHQVRIEGFNQSLVVAL